MATAPFTVLTTNHPTHYRRAQRQYNRSQHPLSSVDELPLSFEQDRTNRPSSHRNHLSTRIFYHEKQKENHQQKSNQQVRYEKLQELEIMKRSQLDQLNLKVRNLIDKISLEESSVQSYRKEHPTRQHLKTDHLSSGESTNLSIYQLQSRITLSDVLSDSQEMSDSTLVKPVALPQSISQHKNKQQDQLQKIRHKYKISSKEKGSTRLKTESNISTNRKQSRLTTNYSQMKSDIQYLAMHLGSKVDIRQDTDQNRKTVQNFNQKRENLLKERNRIIPLQQNTSQFNNHINGCPKDSKKEVQRINSLFEEDFFDSIICSDSGLPTADFRNRQNNNQLNKFLNSIIAQVKLDSQLRQAKKWFKKLKVASKWKNLASILKDNSVYFDNSSVYQIFDLQEEQDCPFYTPRQLDYTIQQMVHLFLDSEEHWFSQIARQYSSVSLEFDGFEEHKLDLSGKGYITISDLIRFINTEMDVQFRSRDLHLIYLRLKSQEKLLFTDIMEVVCQ